MQSIIIDGRAVHFEAPESGRYLAPILVLPGLFQSFDCWRNVTTMLAHRGWEVYCVPRSLPDYDSGETVTDPLDWEGSRRRIVETMRRFGRPCILLGGDVSAAMALEISTLEPVLALGLFAPVGPTVAAAGFQRALGMRGRWRYRRATTTAVAPPAGLSPQPPPEDKVLAEPRTFLDELETQPRFVPPSQHPPAIVYAAENDPLAPSAESLAFGGRTIARCSERRLTGRWWPLYNGPEIADEIHRFLILTLSDRVVEFPEEVLED